MQTRNKYILIVIAAWVFFILLLSALTAYLTISGFIDLEKNVTIDNSNRVMRVINSNLEQVYIANNDLAYWDETYNYVKNKNQEFVDKYFGEDLFKTNKLNYVLILDNQMNVLYSKGYNLINNTDITVPSSMVDFFKKNSKDLIDYPNEHNEILKHADGFGGMLPLSATNDETVFFVASKINNTEETEPANGYIIFGKIINSVFLNHVSDEIGYQTKLLMKPDLKLAPEFSSNQKQPQLKYMDHTILSYMLLQDVNFKPLSILEIKFPRIMYAESINTFIKNSIILLLFALFGMLAMSLLVYAFFKKQELITTSFERFVPHELIELLNKESILDVILGTHSKRNLSVLFMDIRNFTTILEGLTPQQSFDFLNTILKEIAPIVIKNKGFIDKYIGDAIMALFPNTDSHADNAVAAAMMILDEMDRINYTGKISMADKPVKVGIGINTGNSILGIIGAEGRLEGTVISDAVNTASRIESLTKNYDCSLLISEETYKSMKHPEYYQITHIDEAQIKGKTIKVSIYKVEKKH